MNQPENSSESTRNGVTVTQYRGPTMRFESPQEYAEWLIPGIASGDPDFAVDLHEHWDDPSRESENNRIIDAMVERAGADAFTEEAGA